MENRFKDALDALDWIEKHSDDPQLNKLKGLYCQIDKIRAALKLADEMQWRPIATALRDGDIILVTRVVDFSLEYIHASYWCGNGWYLPFDSERDIGGTPLLGENEQPTHWMPLPKRMPLPKPPKKGTEE